MLHRLTKGEVARLPQENTRNDHFLQRLLLTWVYKIVRDGRKGQLKQQELCMPGDQAAEVAAEHFKEAWGQQTSRTDAQPPSLLATLTSTFGLQFAIAGVFKLLWSTFVLLGASYFVNALIEFVQKKDGWDAIPNKGVGWVLACSFFVDSILAGLALQRMGDVSMRVGIKVRAALITAIYRKSFRLQSANNNGGGNVVSLVSTDCIKMYEGVQHFHNYYFGYKIAQHKTENVEVSDARVLRMHEVLLAIKLVKFYVWEKSFARQVKEVRERELELIRQTAVIKTLNLCLVFAVPPPSLSSSSPPTQAVAAMRRLQAFLLLPETEEQPQASEPQAVMKDAELHYGNPAEFTLTVPEFDVKPGEVVAVVGRVGSGKSSILQAILNKMIVSKGSVASPWVQNLSLRDNILFGMPYDEQKYKAVIHACALELDLKILPNGDASMAGERGINLSGGQRQRVCLARAAYHEAELVLLDNPLSAVDQHTSKHIFDKCIKGLLKDKAVVLIAHQLELLPQCNKVAVVKESAVVYFGHYNAVAINKHMPVDHLMGATVEGKESATAPAAAASEKTKPDSHDEDSSNGLIKARHGHTDSQAAECVETPEEIEAKFNGTCKRLSAVQAGLVYFRAAAWSWAADDPAHFYTKNPLMRAHQLYLLVYMALVLLFIGLLLTRDTLFSIWSIRASTNLHNTLFNRVLSAPVLFFLRTPVGDVLNAFARDQDTLDETLPDTLHMTGIYLMILLTSLAIVTTSIYYYAIMTGALILAFFIMQHLYLPSATVLKRWAGDTASSLFVHVDETLQGMDVIRAFNAVPYFIQENVNLLNVHHLALFNTEQTHLWLAFWCDFFGAILVVATCLLSVAFSETLGAPNVGLAISNSIQVLVFFTWVVRGVADTVSMWDAVERVASFATEVPTEVTEEEALESCTNQTEKPLVALGLHRTASNRKQASTTGSFTGPRSGQHRSVRTPAARRQASLRIARTMMAATASSTEGPNANTASDAGVTAVISPRAAAPVNALSVVGSPFHGGGGNAEGGVMLQGVKVVEGDLRFEGVCLRYFPGGPMALRHVSFHVQDCEKVGQAHDGWHCRPHRLWQTTLLMALFRMIGLAGGRIVVDGVDINSMPLREVRKRISIIPQEPVMFKGSVRSNLDPFGEASDNELWHALALVHLKQAVAELPGGLDGPVLEGGSNFSLGQKQLICMARCVLKRTHILVLDEATAAMDLQTDLLIQRTIRRVFQGRTTLTIAHRLDTIIFSDKILAMAQGQVKEFDKPSTLLQDPRSMFNMLVEDTGPVASSMLRQMAAAGPADEPASMAPSHSGSWAAQPAGRGWFTRCPRWD
ncbi:P-loop containing nucleoside triphosphate hydrolase protein [Scenedesmus sp. NREL 46B-D3]|nr:P-loop containing nucleoside triphosphate hydrolase protein [Scenedesmus sp. NREL 46B-D3]